MKPMASENSGQRKPLKGDEKRCQDWWASRLENDIGHWDIEDNISIGT